MKRITSNTAILSARRSLRRVTLIAAAAAAVPLLDGSRAGAADFSWINPGGGAFGAATNWNPTGVPAPSDRAIFNIGAQRYMVGLSTFFQNAQAVIGNDAVQFVSGGYTLDAATDSVIVGDTAGQHGELRLAMNDPYYGKLSGQIHACDFVIGNQAGASGSVSMSTGFPAYAELTVDGLLTVGRSGVGEFASATRTTLRSGDLAIAALPGSTGSFKLGNFGAGYVLAWVYGNVSVGGSAAGPGGTGSFTLINGQDAGGTAADFRGRFDVYAGGTALFNGVSNLQYTTLKHVSVDGGYMAFYKPGAQISGDVSVTNGGTLLLYGSASPASSLSIQGGTVGSNGGSLVFSGGGQIGASTVDGVPSVLQARATFGGPVYIGGGAAGPGGSGEVTSSLDAASVHIWPAGNCSMGYDITAPGGVVNDGVIGQKWISANPDDVTVTGSYTQGPTGELYVRLFGGGGASQSDRLIVNGAANLDGELSLSLLNGVPAGSARHEYTVVSATAGITGAFDNDSPGYFFVDGHPFRIAYSADAVKVTSGLPGDANLDDMVDIADLGILADHWQQNSSDWLTADFTGDHLVDITDLGLLATNWQSGARGSPSWEAALARVGLSGVSVPEPATLVAAVILLLPAVRTRRRRDGILDKRQIVHHGQDQEV